MAHKELHALFWVTCGEQSAGAQRTASTHRRSADAMVPDRYTLTVILITLINYIFPSNLVILSDLSYALAMGRRPKATAAEFGQSITPGTLYSHHRITVNTFLTISRF